MRTWHVGSLRRRFLAIVLFGAIAPLAMTGWWLSRTAVRSAEQLLRAQLDTSASAVATAIERRWVERRGDLLFLAENEVAARTVGSPAAIATAEDNAFMSRLFAQVRATIPRVALRSSSGQLRWSFGDSTPELFDAGFAPSRPPANTASDRRLSVHLPVRDAVGREVGRLDAEIRIRALLPEDSIPVLVNGAQLAVVDRHSGQALTSPDAPVLPRDRASFTLGGVPWIAAQRVMSGASLDVVIAAPALRYVGPFQKAARFGMLMLVLVALLTAGLSVYFTTRVTRSLELLVDAADAVAAGNFERKVDTGGADEVGRLARSFDTMVQSLRRTLAELSHQQALAAVGAFAASLSHEVRNALTAVRLDLQRAEESASPDGATSTLISRALSSVERLNTTVTGSLAVARGGKAEMCPVDLHVVVAAASVAAEDAFTKARSRLDVQSPPDGAYVVRGNAAALQQLFLNLLLNAAQALSPRGVASIEFFSDDSTVTVAIRDSGSGMPDEHLSHGGEPFYSSKPGGTGLGLSIARRIAEAHSGTLTIESAGRAGTVVQVSLPRVHNAKMRSEDVHA